MNSATIISEESSFPVWQPNWKTVIAFLDLETQWRISGTMSAIIFHGLDYSAAVAVLTRRKFRKLLPDLQVMEQAALPILNAGGE